MSPPEKDQPHGGKVEAARERVEALKEKVDEVATRERSRRPTVRAAYKLVEADRQTGGSLLAGGLAYRIFLFALPYALFLSAVAQILGRRTSGDLLGDAGLGANIASTVDDAARSTGRAAPVLLVMSFFLMVWTAQSTFKALRITSELAWGVRSARSAHPVRVALIMTASLVGMSVYHYLFRPLYILGPIADLLASVLAAVGLCALAAWGASALPRPEGVHWVYLLPGAILFGFGFELLRFVTAVFLSGKLDRTIDLYGALGVGAAIMGLLYLIGRLIVTAISMNAQWWRTHTDEAGGVGTPQNGGGD